MEELKVRAVRRLEPYEWEFILGFPPGWTDVTSESPTDVNEIIEILNSTKGDADLPRSTQGHLQFDYSAVPDVSLRHRGWGPLRTALDTNILIDYCRAGLQVWNTSEPVHPDRWHDRLLALADLLTVWTWRDIRLTVFQQQLNDAREALAAEQRHRRVRLLDAFYTVAWEQENWATVEDGAVDSTLHPGTTTLYQPCDASFIRNQLDRQIVEAAFRAGCHVLLTEDERHILRHRRKLAEYGLAAMRPAELLRHLWKAGELTMERCVSGLVPDNHGFVHLISVLEEME